MSQVDNKKTGKEYWRSLDELADSPSFRMFYEREFQDDPGNLNPKGRRKFLKLLGASLALAGITATSCTHPEEYIAPYAHRPEGREPGVPVQFATAMELSGVAHGLLVTSYDGRPIKVEGNPSHPINRNVFQSFESAYSLLLKRPEEQIGIRERLERLRSSQGASSVFEQASLLEMYDPDRSKSVIHREGGKSTQKRCEDFASFAAPHFEELRKKHGDGLHILCEATHSPSLIRARDDLLKTFTGAVWHEYEPISCDNAREGARLIYGTPYRAEYDFSQASTIVSLDADFLVSFPASVKYAGDFAKQRRPEGGKMSRLYVIEARHSVTGSNADHRLAVEADEIAQFAVLIAAELFINRDLQIPEGAGEIRAALTARAHADPRWQEMITRVADDLEANRGKGLVICGPSQPPEAHALSYLLNAALGNVGRTILFADEPRPERIPHNQSISKLANKMGAGKVDTLVILGGNPAYNAPADLDFADKLKKVPTSIHLSLFDDETSALCTWHLQRAHYLESWGDSLAYEGTICLTQPLIEPLYSGKTPLEIISNVILEDVRPAREIIRDSLKGSPLSEDPEVAFKIALADGIVHPTRWRQTSPKVISVDWAKSLREINSSAGSEGVNLVFAEDYSTYDGRFANNGWLQEMPDPLTKLTWDNAALVSPKLATSRGLKTGDFVRIELDERSIEIPVYIMPGQAERTITLPLGYGRKVSGRVGRGVGFDVYPLRTTSAMYFTSGATLTKTDKRHKLVATQDHHAIDMDALGRSETERRLDVLVREATLSEYKENPEFAKHGVHHPPLESLWREQEYGGYKWAMSIDLNACIGCGACQIACQAENNIPVVGKDEVARGREMNWIRVDRYFRGDVNEPVVVHQPVTCHHCENAPCEQVCPVAATTHSEEGLNQMVYNRCVGTRYCSDNCPYKVRRFNFFNNHKGMDEIEKMIHNPEVTVRSRGVMEKCTFCIQRIQATKIKAKNDGRKVTDGEIVPACAQTCPTRAIVFGDLNDPESAVSKLHAGNRAYAMLEELNVKPRTKYLARVRNPSNGGKGAGSTIPKIEH